MRKEFRRLISLEEARSRVLDHTPLCETEQIHLSSSLGRVLAERIVSTLDVPGFARASMDGYAVRSEDTLGAREDRPLRLRHAGSISPGLPADLSVEYGEAVEVSTGSMMPEGADAVVMIEYAQPDGEEILIRRPVSSGENVQAAGSDIGLGERVLSPGTRLSPREIGVLAALGIEEVPVRRLTVGVASTGNELLAPGRELLEGRIYDINSYSIASAVQECGGTPLIYGIIPDEHRQMREALERMAEGCRLILVSGSTSAGAGDMIFQVLEEIGDTVFHGVSIKPGKPTIFGLVGGVPCIGLPGYPTSALTVFYLLAAPAIRGALGLRAQESRTRARLARGLRSESRHQLLAVGILRGLAYPVDKGSGSITTLASADGIIEIPADQEYLERGEAVEVRLLGAIDPPDLVVAGESSVLLERLADSLQMRVRLIPSVRGEIYLEDGMADIACVSGLRAPPPGTVVVGRLRRELGLILRRGEDPLRMDGMRIMGWHKDSAMGPLLKSALKELGVHDPAYVRAARTHSAVASAVAGCHADLGFGERAAAEEMGLGFLPLLDDEMSLLAMAERSGDHAVVRFISLIQRDAVTPASARSSPGDA